MPNVPIIADALRLPVKPAKVVNDQGIARGTSANWASLETNTTNASLIDV